DIFNQRSNGVTTMGRLADKNILITGGNSGIGLAAAQEFDREGARVAICGLNEGSLQAAKETLGPGSLAIRADVSNLADLDTMFATIKREFGHLDGLFVNAGHGDFRSRPRRRAGRGGKGRPPNQQSKQAVGPAFGNREAGGLPCVGRFCVRGRGRLLDRRRGHGHFGRGCLSLVIMHEEVMPSKPMSTAPALSAGPRSSSRPWTLALTSVAAFMVVLDMLVVVTALPAIRRVFGA